MEVGEGGLMCRFMVGFCEVEDMVQLSLKLPLDLRNLIDVDIASMYSRDNNLVMAPMPGHIRVPSLVLDFRTLTMTIFDSSSKFHRSKYGACQPISF